MDLAIYFLKVPSEDIPVLINLIYNYFKTIEKIKNFNSDNRFRSSIVSLSMVHNIMVDLMTMMNLKNDEEFLEKPELVHTSTSPKKYNFLETASLVANARLFRKKILSKKTRQIIKNTEDYKLKIRAAESNAMKLEPKVENRIIRILNQEVWELIFKQIF